MSYQEAHHPDCEATSGHVEMLIHAKRKSLGEFSVRRVLPARERRTVGPFIFFDHMGPAEFPPGQGVQVRPHPHIGIATITYLFDGEIMHADSLGFSQPITSGAVNLMTAGRGIVHSERAGSDLHSHAMLHGIQSWIALPDGKEEIEPAFVHTPSADIPSLNMGDAEVRIIMGHAYGEASPVKTYSQTLYLHCELPSGAEIELPTDADELAVYPVSGSVELGDTTVPEGVMAVACRDRALSLRAREDARVMVIGGQSVGPRHIWWNFVSSSKDRIERAKSDWQNGVFDRVPGDDEFIPLP